MTMFGWLSNNQSPLARGRDPEQIARLARVIVSQWCDCGHKERWERRPLSTAFLTRLWFSQLLSSHLDCIPTTSFSYLKQGIPASLRTSIKNFRNKNNGTSTPSPWLWNLKVIGEKKEMSICKHGLPKCSPISLACGLSPPHLPTPLSPDPHPYLHCHFKALMTGPSIQYTFQASTEKNSVTGITIPILLRNGNIFMSKIVI